MPRQLIMMMFRNLFRSKTRLAITLVGCLIAGFVTSFFLSAEQSLSKMTATTSKDSNIVVRQKDRY